MMWALLLFGVVCYGAVMAVFICSPLNKFPK
jgi:hypothetical protein